MKIISQIKIRRLIQEDIIEISEAFLQEGLKKDASLFHGYLTEQNDKLRNVFVATGNNNQT